MAPDAWLTLAATLLGMSLMLVRALVTGGQAAPARGPVLPGRADDNDDDRIGRLTQASKLHDDLWDEVRTLVPYIRAVLRSRGVPRGEEPDLLQAVLVGAWLAITNGRYHPDPASSLRAWIAEIARRQAAKYLRSARRRWERITDPDEMHDEGPRMTPPDEILEHEQGWQFVTEELNSPDHMQSVLIAHDLDGVPMAEIARARRVPVSTAYRWRAAALESLRRKARRR